ncbi:hypothetical protein DBR11_00680 [Pedobacter sp. HMWF019]|uniref:glycosyltransferase family 4 protein n=1 Tax=Pedobacter sp. HMWF019 TaxID=2056856 RepID=UPI000D3ACA7B|nr:glycosyltransferase family 4 protein [Pedobacter sp. HMWF019]PTT04031.1 hypothetical protein DBR11_00680 [Pedobacter sp. HMWF019]
MKEKIAFILNSIDGGGIDRVVTTFANEIAQAGQYEVVLILLHRKPHFFALHPEVKVIENRAGRKGSSKLRYMLRTGVFVRRTLKELNPLRVVSNGEWLNSFVYLSSWGLSYPIYFTDHSNPERKGQSPFPYMDKLIYPRAKGVLVLSEAAKEKVKNVFGQQRVFVVDNPICFPETSAVEKEDVVICMGRLSPEKGQDVLIRAFSKVESNWKLHLLGDGKMRPSLEKLADELGIRNRVVFLGLQQDIAGFLSKASIYVMPSHTENFPMALLEAMSLGLPCVATNCMPWRKENDFIKGGYNGIKVPVNDPESMAAGLHKLMKDASLRAQFAERAVEIKDRYSLKYIVNDFLTALELNTLS